MVTDSSGHEQAGQWRVFKRYFFLIAVGIVALLVNLVTLLGSDDNLAPLSSANVLRITLIGAFFTLLVFAHRDVSTIFRVANSILVPITVLIFFTYIWLDAESADSLAREDLLIEDFSFLFLTAGAACMGISALYFYFRDRQKLAAALSMLAAIVFLLIALEEVSWFQRELDYDTNEFFRVHNDQGETSFHNIYNQESEDIYYFGGFLLLVAVPFFRTQFVGLLRRIRLTSLEILLPPYWLLGPFVLAGSFIAQHYVSRGANVVIALGSIIILAGALERHYLRRQWVQLGQMALSLIIMLALITYLLSVDFSGRDVRPWIGKEYQESYLAWGIGAYGVSVLLEMLVQRRQPEDHPLISPEPQPIELS